MSNLYCRDYRMEIRPCASPDGWSAQLHLWSCYGGTTRLLAAFALPIYLAFATAEEAYAPAEQVGRQWVGERVHATSEHARES